MKMQLLRAALALAGLLLSGAALADDPHDPTMRSKAARARDHAIIKGLNQRELARVRARDARVAHENARRRAEHGLAMARYQRDLTRWRRAVAACRAGDWRYCDR